MVKLMEIGEYGLVQRKTGYPGKQFIPAKDDARMANIFI
jgi:hypothetical protein